MTSRRDWKREAAGYIVASIIVVMFGFMLLALAAVMDEKGFKSAEAASWVQAIGSIAAIFGAFMFGERQANHARETALAMQDRDRSRKNVAFLAICTAAVTNVNLIERVFCIRPYDGLSRLASFKESSTEHILKALQTIPVHEVGSAEAVTALLRTIDNFQWLLLLIEAFDAALKQDSQDRASSRITTPNHEEYERGNIGRIVESIQDDYELLKRELKAS